MIDGRQDLVVAGEPLNTGLLRRFYARHGFEPVWATRRDQANELVAAVLKAPDQGLDPARFHGSLLQHGGNLSPLERELVLSDAFLSYADALARGAVPPERRGDDEVLTPEPIDVTAVLDDAVRSYDPAAVIEALAPTTPSYQALREALQKYRAGAPVGGRTAADRLRTIAVNLERQRWLPRLLPADRAWVNTADERLVLYRDGDPVFSTRVVVGEDIKQNQSPEFRATIDASFYNPPWVIPADIAKAEILPKVTRDPDYLTKNKMVLLANGEVEQLPGPEAGLGYIMFDMPNHFDVYLHDTPDREIFARDNRRPQPWLHPGAESAGVCRPADGPAARRDQRRDRDGQHHPQQSADTHAGLRGVSDRVCRFRWEFTISPGFLQPRCRDLAIAAGKSAGAGAGRASG